MTFTKEFKDISNNDVLIAGGKGASLGEMTQAGIPVPEGYVILSTTFDEFIQKSGLNDSISKVLNKVTTEDIESVNKASKNIQDLILNSDIPEDIRKKIENEFKILNAEFVAVRSSATSEDSADAAWAGQLDSFLNTNKDSLLTNVRRCWASLFTPRAIFYRFEKGLDKTDVSVAVVVQKMVQSEVSGIAFSVHPVTEDYNSMIIEGGLGLGEAIVSGSVTPDSYVVSKNSLEVTEITVNEQSKKLVRGVKGNVWVELGEEGQKQFLSKEQILTLAKLIIKIENHYNFPCDIEWAYENDSFYITQSRPITTLSKKEVDGSKLIIGHVSEYQRMFSGTAMPYLISDLFMNYYKKLDVLCIFENNVWTSYLPLNSMEKTLGDGLNLFSSLDSFEKFNLKFEEYKNEVLSLGKVILSDDKLDLEKIKKLVILISNFWDYYSKSEFFYVDSAYDYYLSNPNKNIFESKFESFKNEGRKFMNSLFFGSDSYFMKVLSKLAPGLKKDVSYLLQLSLKEFIQLLDGNMVEDIPIEGRLISYVMSGNSNSIIYLEGKDSLCGLKNFDLELSFPKQVMSGKVANSGRYTGTAKVIPFGYDNFDRYSKFISEMSKGDVLVSETTAPELMLACKKAGAILTNQGGMMSHAAIVSRELGVPCIVGLGNITQVLKDGMQVEVDANEGFVKLIEKDFVDPLEKNKFVLGNPDADASFLTVEMTWDGVFRDPRIKSWLGIQTPESFVEINKRTSINMFIHNEDFVEFVKKCADKIKTDSKFLSFQKKETIKASKSIRDFANSLLDKVDKTSLEDLPDLLLKCKSLQAECATFGTVVAFADVFGDLTNESLEILNKRNKLKYDLSVYSRILTSPEKPSLTEQAYEKINSKKFRDEDLLKEFYWLNQGYIGRGLTQKELDLIKTETLVEDNVLKEEDILAELKLTSEELKVFEVIKDLVFIKSLRSDSRQFLHVLINRIVDKISSELNVPSALLESMYTEEICEMILSKSIPENLEKRANKSVGVPNGLIGDGYTILLEDLAEDYKKEHLEEELIKECSEIKGQVAFPGKVKGIAKLVFGPQHNSKVKKGDILFSPSTSPQFVPAMKKAKAFVTDLGGVTSHAAIVAREMKKPCIVGTKHGTQIIKDRDLVEVDANNGVVKIINHN